MPSAAYACDSPTRRSRIDDPVGLLVRLDPINAVFRYLVDTVFGELDHVDLRLMLEAQHRPLRARGYARFDPQQPYSIVMHKSHSASLYRSTGLPQRRGGGLLATRPSKVVPNTAFGGSASISRAASGQ
jgi:hypothetical protein